MQILLRIPAIGAFTLLTIACVCNAMGQSATAVPDFASEIKPILATYCWSCHGPDEAARQADLRLDIRELAIAGGSIVPGEPAKSSLVERIHSQDPEKQMPPPESKRSLSEHQRKLLRDWIASGAPYSKHWSFAPLQTQTKSEVSVAELIDNLVREKLSSQGLRPSPKADRETLLRRIALDLTGLPPSEELAKAFLQDESPEATQRLVDRLLASEAYAERMAAQWLDLARYADTNGYNNDEDRQMWPWRDWVIEAYHRNMPFDQFLTEQLAGDLLPNATVEQKIATGFLRNQGHNTEGGIIQEEYRVEYVADRVHTTATVFLGLSMQCARCHDHKVDPFSQAEYYKFFALFNNLEEKQASYSGFVAAEPFLRVPTKEQQAEAALLRKEISRLESEVELREKQLPATWSSWLEKQTDLDLQRTLGAKEVIRESFDDATDASPPEANPVGGNQASVSQSGVGGSVWKNLKDLELGDGKTGKAVQLAEGRHLISDSVGKLDAGSPFSISVWIHPKAQGTMAILSKMDESKQHRGYDMLVVNGKIEVHLVDQWPANAIKVSSQQVIPPNEWHHVAMTYDGTKKASGIKFYIDGKQTPFDVPNDSLTGTIDTEQPFRLGLRQTSLPYQGLIDELRIYDGRLSAEALMQLANSENPKLDLAWVRTAWSEWTPEQTQTVKRWAREIADPSHSELLKSLEQEKKKLGQIDQTAPAVMVLQEMSPARETFILKRGQYDQPTDKVDSDIPEILKIDGGGRIATRLDLARWLTHPRNPLTARVAVNRLWEQCFGVGLVRTSEDFGGTGELPLHRELLDQLADSFIKQGWDVKAMLRGIVLSDTYQQQSRMSNELASKDPENRFFARGPRHRLSAETIRDNALAISGLLVAKVGGPSVKPYQPDGLWEDVTVERRGKYVADQGENLYRRGLYTFWKRTCPPPSMVTFDAPNREVCVARRSRTNTPLQALVLLNDPTYLEAARAFAADILRKGGENDLAKLQFAIRKALVRQPRPEEIPQWISLLEVARSEFKEPKRATEFLHVGTLPVPTDLPESELAVWTLVGNTILNLDETITKY